MMPGYLLLLHTLEKMLKNPEINKNGNKIDASEFVSTIRDKIDVFGSLRDCLFSKEGLQIGATLKLINMFNLFKKIIWRCSDDNGLLDLKLFSSMLHELN